MAARHIGGGKALLQLLPRGGGPCPSPSLSCSLQLVSWLSSGSSAGSGGAAPADGRAAPLSTAPPLPELDAAEVAKALRCQQFYEEEIQTLKALKSSLPLGQLLDFMQQRGFTLAAAQDVIGRLERSGALLNMHGTVLLRPGEVARALALVLPGTAAHTQQRLSAVQAELGELEVQQAAVGRRAAWRQRGLVWGGLASQAALWGLLLRLTFYELSWDVMEPFCFFVGGGQALLCYSYFVATRKEFGWEKALERHVGRWEAGQLRRAGFDVQRYARLRGEAARLGELLAAQQQEQQAAAARQAAAQQGEEAAESGSGGGVEGKKEA